MLIVASEQGVVVEDVPERVVDLFESDGLAVEGLREELLTGVKSEAASVADAAQLALGQYRARPVSFSDCLVLEVARKAGHLPPGTFDRDLAKLEGAQRL